MTEKLGFDSIQEDENGFKPRLAPGIHEVTIISMEEPEDKEYYELLIGNDNGDCKIKFYNSDVVKEGKKGSALDYSLKSAKHLATHTLDDEEKSKLTANSMLELLRKMLKKTVGKSVRIKLIGEEYLRQKDGTVGVNAKLGFAPFAENLDTVPTQLKFDPNNVYDYKRLPAGSVPKDFGKVINEKEGPFSEAKDGDLPF